MLLRLRGVRTSDEEPEVLEAMRFALFAEKLAGEYQAVREVMDITMSSVPKADRGQVGLQKAKAHTQYAHLRRVLLLDEED